MTVISTEEIRKRIYELEPELISVRRWLHEHAELSWKEVKSTEYITNYLTKVGLDAHEFEGHTGCWTEIKGGQAGDNAKTILLRSDFDALPINEESGLPFASTSGVAHCCGHDLHAAMLLIAAKVLAENADRLPGNVRILFQAAEETAIGAKYYVDQGITEGADAVYGCHVMSTVPAGQIGIKEGPMAAATDEFRISIQGKGCHGGMPHMGKDALVVACSVVMNLQTIVSRMTDPIDSAVITVGKIEAGSAYNVVADQATLVGTARSYDPKVRRELPNKMKMIADGIAAAYNCTAEVEYQFKTGPVFHDDEHMIMLCRKAAEKLFGSDKIINPRPIGGGDDFAYYLEKLPGLYSMIGAEYPDEDGAIYPQHHPKVRFNEDALAVGAAMHVQVAADFLSEDA